MNPEFIHLRVHSDYSMLDGLNKIKPLLDECVEQSMPAMALTDQMNMCGLVKFYSEAHKRGIKPIIGTDFWVQDLTQSTQLFRLTLLATDNDGYNNITVLISKAYQRGHVLGRAVIDKQ